MSGGGPTATRLEAGDPLRAVAALSVAVHHFAFGAALSASLWFTDAYGPVAGRLLAALDVGLYVFFVLSGYLIAGPFVRAYVSGAAMPRLGRYYRNRLLRIVPAFWVVFTVLLVVHGRDGSSWWDVAAVYLFAQNFDASTVELWVGQAWTLSLELVFYALVPAAGLLLVRAPRRPSGEAARLRLVLALCAVVWVGSLAVRELVPDDLFWQRLFPAIVFAFMPGVALACVRLAVAGGRVPRRPRRTAALLVAGSAAAWLLYAASAPAWALAPVAGALPALLASLSSAMLVAAPMVLQWGGARCPRALDNRVLHWVGERSYGLYLVHQGLAATLLGWLALGGDPRVRFLEQLAIALPLSLAAAAVLFALVERPLLARRERVRAPGGVPSAAPASEPARPA